MPTPEDFLRCHTFGHTWFEYDTDWTPLFGTPITLRCERCTMERRDSIDASGNVGTRRYIPHPEYRYAKGARPSRADMRLTIISLRLRERRAAKRRAAG